MAEAISTSARKEVAALDAGLPDDLWWSFTGGLDTCFSEHDGEYRNCCMRAGLAYALKVHEDRLRADCPPLTDEYGMRVFHVSALIEERAIADTLGGALEVLAEFDARERPGVVSRKLRVREVGPWRDVEQEGERG